jgi:hypothetical protein
MMQNAVILRADINREGATFYQGHISQYDSLLYTQTSLCLYQIEITSISQLEESSQLLFFF